MQMLLGGVICWRLMLVPESSILGETLWVTLTTIAVLVVWAGLQLFSNRGFVRFDRWDALVWLTIAGHAMSMALLWNWGADKRAGINLCWEWVSLGVLFFLLRQTIRTREEAGNLVRLLIAIGFCFACLGIWQKYYEHLQKVREYTEMQQRYDDLQALSAAGPLSFSLADELRKLELEFSQYNIPLDPQGRVMFQSRLQYSSEPSGRWALANSLGGFLAVGLVLCSAFIGNPRGGIRRLLWTIPIVGVVAFALFLTHSRTAWAALSIALVGIVLTRWECSVERRRTILKVSIGVATIGAILLGVTLVTIDATNLDGNFVTRSLKTRIQYWIATTEMLSEHSLFGVGPGNFRQHYLAYKLPESSEEIQDPHNFVLDLWANGGAIAILAWLGLLGLLARDLGRNFLSPENDLSRADSTSETIGLRDQVHNRFSNMLIGASLALLILFLHSVLRDYVIGWELLMFALAVPAIAWLLPSPRVSERSFRAACLWGIVAMSIHLLGAGGIEMPGIVSVLLILIALTIRSESVPLMSVQRRVWTVLGWGIAGIALTWSCFLTAAAPVHARKLLINEAYYQMSEHGDVADARELIREATTRDRWAAEPWRQLAELELSIWRNDPRDDSAFERARKSLEEAKKRDPWSGRDARFLGEVYKARFELTNEPEWGERALEEFEIANARIPHNERILLQIALLAEASNLPEKAESAANKAIEIDRISRKNGHWEKLLSEQELGKLVEILESP
ncbi:MAG TPA: O-antigen ligase family protein [Planctomycetaceae bacterium]|nr:O-antigen ligase family protein [Planctomycetaceae bacterium]